MNHGFALFPLYLDWLGTLHQLLLCALALRPSALLFAVIGLNEWKQYSGCLSLPVMPPLLEGPAHRS